jgi:nucleoid-associated protein YgaU
MKRQKNREKALRFIIVKPGDTLGSIARRAYGRASAYVKIYKANPDLLKSPDQIYVGMKLRVPVDEEYVGK